MTAIEATGREIGVVSDRFHTLVSRAQQDGNAAERQRQGAIEAFRSAENYARRRLHNLKMDDEATWEDLDLSTTAALQAVVEAHEEAARVLDEGQRSDESISTGA
jgi:hypothetical protein